MSKIRIVIYGFTLLRDVASSLVLKELLENRGAKVFIADSRNIKEVMKLWKPDAIVINTAGKLKKFKLFYPDAKIIFLAGEGGEPEQSHDARFLATGYIADVKKENYQDNYNMIDQILLWGKYDLEIFNKYFPDDDKERIIVGNPRLDLTKFRPNSLKLNNKTIGFISRFNMINSFNRNPLAKVLRYKGNLERASLQANQFCVFWEIIRYLVNHTDYNISYRAYTLEAVDVIKNIFKNEFGDRVNVDSSLAFTEWVQKQKVIITPASTSFFEPYILGVPIINIDYLIGQKYVNKSKKLFPFASYSYDVAYNPKSYDSLYALLDKDLTSKQNNNVDQYLDLIHNYNTKSSALKNSAVNIIRLLTSIKNTVWFRLPLFLFKIIDWIHFRRTIYRNPSLEFFNYNEYHHKTPVYCKQVIKNIEFSAD